MQKGKDICKLCEKFKEIHTKDGLCNSCYKKVRWKRKMIKCKRCERVMTHHAKGFCPGCYNSIFHIDKVKLHNAKRQHNIGQELYKKLVEKCIICDFDKIVEIHHIDHNHKNSSPENLVGLCPNCHKMIHHKKYQTEIFSQLKEKGFAVPKGYEMDGFFTIKSQKSQS